MFKKYQLIFIILIIVILSLAITLIAQVKNIRSSGTSRFSAVYLEGGDIYFGELSLFPSPKLKNGWYLQRSGAQAENSQLSLNPLSGAFWGPESEINLNRNKIIFWAKLRSDSQVAKFLENPTVPTNPDSSLSPTP